MVLMREGGQLYCDAQQFPRLFCWSGPVSSETIRSWLRVRDLKVPDDLLELWVRTGGGSIFESEELLCPIGRADYEASIDEVNQQHAYSGCPPEFLIFATGAFLSAVGRSDGQYVILNPTSYGVQEYYSSLEDWYKRTVRAEYARKYGLKDV